MRLSDAWATYGEYSQAASENARKLAFAVAAVGWFFYSNEPTHTDFLIWSLALIISFFVFDLAQYVVGAERRRRHTPREELKHEIRADTDLDKIHIDWRVDLDRPTLWLYSLKLATLAVAAGFLLPEFVVRLS